jgi:hypothetical protein
MNTHTPRSRLASHLRCLEEDATNSELSQLDRLALVRDRARRIREIEAESTRVEFTRVHPASHPALWHSP